MATRQFTLNTQPHVAQLGDDLKLKFVPEVMGDDFLQGYAQLQESYREAGATPGNAESLDIDKLTVLLRELRAFLFKLMIPESQAIFARFVVVQQGKEVATYTSQEEADAHTGQLKGAIVRDDSLKLPTRSMIEIAEWLAEVYGGGERPTGSSSGSATPSRPAGRRGTGTSRSRA